MLLSTTLTLMLIWNIGISATPMNLSMLKQDLERYHDSGQYQREIASVITQAQRYMLKRSQQNKTHEFLKKKLALVLDIDETSLSNYADMKKLDFGGTPQMINRGEDIGKDPAIKPTLKLYRFAKQHGIKVFFITGRLQQARTPTVKNLQAVGYSSWAKLYMKPNDYHQASVVPYKSSRRKQITEQGYDIIANIGDQYSDLAGGYADKSFKLPNPYYYIP